MSPTFATRSKRTHVGKPPHSEGTTVRATVEVVCGNPIVNDGDLGPGALEPDRIDFLFLPGDMCQSGNVNPLDLVRYNRNINCIPPATQAWAGVMANHPQP